MALPARLLTEPRSRTPQASLERTPDEGLERLAWRLDSAIVVPGTRFRVGVEALVGIVPVVGDLFDAAWKANQRNAALLRQYAAVPRRAHAQSRLVVGGWLLAIFAITAGIAMLAFVLIRGLWVELQ